MNFDRAAHCRKIARKGGQSLVEKYGRTHMQEIGHKGFIATTNKYFQRSTNLHKQWLGQMGRYNYLRGVGELYGRKFDYIEKPVHPATREPWF